MKVCTCVVPDHEFINASFKIENHPRGPGYWKFYNLHLLDPAYNEQVRQIIFKTEQEYELLKSYRLTWELLKIRIKEFSVHFALKKAHNDARINLLIDKLNSYQCNIDHKYRELLQWKTKTTERTTGNIW